MKKYIVVILIEILLLFNLSICLYTDVLYIKTFIVLGYYYNYFAILNFIGTLTILSGIILIAIKDFTVFKPLLDKMNARKQKRAQAKAERAEADKQAKIAELEAQLQELKKDDN